MHKLLWQCKTSFQTHPFLLFFIHPVTELLQNNCRRYMRQKKSYSCGCPWYVKQKATFWNRSLMWEAGVSLTPAPLCSALPPRDDSCWCHRWGAVMLQGTGTRHVATSHPEHKSVPTLLRNDTWKDNRWQSGKDLGRTIVLAFVSVGKCGKNKGQQIPECLLWEVPWPISFGTPASPKNLCQSTKVPLKNGSLVREES